MSALAGGNLVASAVRMVGGFLSARCIEPAVLGLFSGIGLVQGYLPFLQLGILNGLNRELPYFVGKGDHARVRELAAAAQAWALTLAATAALALTGVAAWYACLGKWAYAAGWLTNAATAFFLFYGTYYLQITFRTRGDFARLALINVVQSVASLVLVAVVWWLAFYGLCVRAVLVGCLQVALLWHWRPVRVAPAWNRKHFVHLLRVGAPIFAVGQLYAYWTTLDGTLMLWYCGPRGLGLYALAGMASTAMLMLPLALSQVIYPQMAEEYGRSGSIRAIAKSAVRPMALALLVVLPLTALGWVLVPSVVRMVLPKYVDAIPAVQWSLLVAPVMCLVPVINIFNVVQRQVPFALAILLGMAAYYGSLLWLQRNHADLKSFPQAMLIGRIVFVTAVYGGLALILRGTESQMLPPLRDETDGHTV